jgi:hypothetical protein
MSVTRDQAEDYLKRFVCQTEPVQLSQAEQADTRRALLTLVQGSDYQTLGVCADTLSGAIAALNQYLQALGHQQLVQLSEPSAVVEPVYCKYNTRKVAWYVDHYPGIYRGVLVTCQSDFEDGVVGTYGHLPLDLFAEMS